MRRISEKQEAHLKYMRSLRPVDWQNKSGRPTKKKEVCNYRMQHPDVTKYRCSKDTGISINTVNKWWNQMANEGGDKVDGKENETPAG